MIRTIGLSDPVTRAKNVLSRTKDLMDANQLLNAFATTLVNIQPETTSFDLARPFDQGGKNEFQNVDGQRPVEIVSVAMNSLLIQYAILTLLRGDVILSF